MAHLLNAGDKSVAKYYQMNFLIFSKVTCTASKNTTPHQCVVPPVKLQTLISPPLKLQTLISRNGYTEELTYLFQTLPILVDKALI